MNDMFIVREFSKRIWSAFPDADIYFYGSRIAGTHSDDSDYDVLVALDTLSPVNRNRVYNIAWETGFQYDAFIAPVLAEKKEMQQHKASPFYQNATRYGRVL